MLGFDLHTTSNSSPEEIDFEDANIHLSLGDGEYCLGLYSDTRPSTANGRKPLPRTQLHHLSFIVDTDAELAALAARLKMSGIELSLKPRESNPDLGDTLWFNDPDGNQIEIASQAEDVFALPLSHARSYGYALRPLALQHIALSTTRLEEMVDFYTEALGFDISDWLLRESVWLRCNTNHHTLMFTQGRPGIDHLGYTIADGTDVLRWADQLSNQQVPILWGPGRHGAGNDLFLRLADADGIHIELSAGLQQYHDRDVTTPPRLWHTRTMALNLWGVLPSWVQEEVRV